MLESQGSGETEACTSCIKIVLAGTIASGKTTLLAALPFHKGDLGVDVTPYTPPGLDSETRRKSAEFRIDVCNCFSDMTGARCLDRDPWPEATDPGKIPTKLFFQIVSHGITHKISCIDFAGETFLDAFDKMCDEQKKTGTEKELLLKSERVRQEIGKTFKEEIEHAKVVLIVVSCKDILDFPNLLMYEPGLAKRMQFAYTLMVDKAKELKAMNREGVVEVLFVITQCDQYKAMLSNNKSLFEKGLKLLVAGASCDQIERIYTSSAYQTELKKIVTDAGKAESVKFCPVSDLRRDDGRPSSLGLKTIVDRIIAVSSRNLVGIGEMWERIKGEFDSLEDKAKHAMDRARQMIALVKKKSKDPLADFDLNGDIRRVELALKDFLEMKEEVMANGYYTAPSEEAIHGLKAAIKKVKPGIDNQVGRLNRTIEGVASRYGIRAD